MIDIDGEFNGIINRSFALSERQLLSKEAQPFFKLLPRARNLVFNSIPDFLLECPDDYLELSELVVFGFTAYWDVKFNIHIHWDKLTEGISNE